LRSVARAPAQRLETEREREVAGRPNLCEETAVASAIPTPEEWAEEVLKDMSPWSDQRWAAIVRIFGMELQPSDDEVDEQAKL
jgi:hypothetical protein